MYRKGPFAGIRVLGRVHCAKKREALSLTTSLSICFQVVDFLSGKAPLNLTMRLGDHMMLIQLQLSTVNSSASKRARNSAARAAAAAAAAAATATAQAAQAATGCSSPSCSSATAPRASTSAPSSAATAPPPTASTSSSTASSSSSSGYKPKLDTRALAEASKNLTQTLKQLSSEVLTTKNGEEVSKQAQKKEIEIPPAKKLAPNPLPPPSILFLLLQSPAKLPYLPERESKQVAVWGGGGKGCKRDISGGREKEENGELKEPRSLLSWLRPLFQQAS